MFLLDWTLVRLADGDDDFILADNPVSLYDPTPAFPGGGQGILSSPTAQMFVPIDARTGILLESNPTVSKWARENLEALHEMTPDERVVVVDAMEGGWAEAVPTSEFARDLNLRSYAGASQFIFGSQQSVQAVRAMRIKHAPRLAELAPRGPRLHFVEGGDANESPMRITRTIAPKPRD